MATITITITDVPERMPDSGAEAVRLLATNGEALALEANGRRSDHPSPQAWRRAAISARQIMRVGSVPLDLVVAMIAGNSDPARDGTTPERADLIGEDSTVAERDEARRLFCELLGCGDCGPCGDAEDVARERGWDYLYATEGTTPTEANAMAHNDSVRHYAAMKTSAGTDLARALRQFARASEREEKAISDTGRAATHMIRSDLREMEQACLAYDKASAALSAIEATRTSK